MEDFEDEQRFAECGSFSLAGETDNYRLSISSCSSDAGNSFTYHEGGVFSTKDRDNDDTVISCARKFLGGWWYKRCHASNLNGFYWRGSHTDYASGVNWHAWRGHYYSLKRTEMKLRPLP